MSSNYNLNWLEEFGPHLKQHGVQLLNQLAKFLSLWLCSLTFPGPLLEDGRETVTYDADTGKIFTQ